MLFGFGEHGFNPHRYVFNCLEEPITVVKHDCLYCMVFNGRRIMFWPDIDRFAAELGEVFPSEKEQIVKFYADLYRIYLHVMIENPIFAAPDELDGKGTLHGLLRHPLSYARFLGYLNMDTKKLLRKYFKDPEIFKFFDKLTSTYCYTTTAETPATLAAVMFVDNHTGGSYYPAGSSAFLPGKLEKVIEANGGEMLMERTVTRILFEQHRPVGVQTGSGEKFMARNLIYAGAVGNFFSHLVPPAEVAPQRLQWAKSLVMTYPSVVLYVQVPAKIIPADTLPVEMLVGNPDMIDESEVTAYIPSLDDQTLCPSGSHVLLAIGPSLVKWALSDSAEYQRQKEAEQKRLLAVLELRFPGLSKNVILSEVATPRTIERYTQKPGGNVAGPKQMLGQHMLKRLHTRSEWDNLFFCGESTVMGTGTPAVTVSGISAANAILKKSGLKLYDQSEGTKNMVRVIDRPATWNIIYDEYSPEIQQVLRQAARCQFCEHPACMTNISLDIRGIMRRVTVGNLDGAGKLLSRGGPADLVLSEGRCIQKDLTGQPVAIRDIINFLNNRMGSGPL